MMFLLMAIVFCPHLYADKEMVVDTVITIRVDTTVVQKNPHYLGKTISVTYYTLEEYAKKTGRPSLPDNDCNIIYYIYRDTLFVTKAADTPMEVTVDSTGCHADADVSWAVKTNLLWDALLAPNVEVEVPIGRKRRWTVMGEWWNPWYTWRHNSRAYQVQLFGAELRRWNRIPDRCHEVMTGMFWGVYSAWAKYDLEWNSHGNQGEVYSLGITAGWATRIARHLHLELSASLGGFYSPLRHYHGMFDDTHLIWQHNDHIFYVGPTKLKVSLVWMLPRFGKKGGRR